MGVRKDCRRQGVGTALLGYAQQECQRELTVMNIPSEAKGMFSFLRKRYAMLWSYLCKKHEPTKAP